MLKKPYFVTLLTLTSVVLLALTVVTTIRTRDTLTRTEIPPKELFGQVGPGPSFRLISNNARRWIGSGLGPPGSIPQIEAVIADIVNKMLHGLANPPPPGQEPDLSKPLPPQLTYGGQKVDIQWVADFIVWVLGSNGAGVGMRALFDFKDINTVMSDYKLKIAEIEADPDLTPAQKAQAKEAARAKAIKDMEEEKKDLQNGGTLYTGMLKAMKEAAAAGRGLSPAQMQAFQSAVKGIIDGINARNAEALGKCWKIPNTAMEEAQSYMAQANSEGPGNEEGGCVLPLPGGYGSGGGHSGGPIYFRTMTPIASISLSALSAGSVNTSDIYYLLLYFHDFIYGRRAWGNYADIDSMVRLLVDAPDTTFRRFVSDLKNRYGDTKTLFARIANEQEQVTEPLLPTETRPMGADWFAKFWQSSPFWYGAFANNPDSDMIKLLQKVNRLEGDQ